MDGEPCWQIQSGGADPSYTAGLGGMGLAREKKSKSYSRVISCHGLSRLRS